MLKVEEIKIQDRCKKFIVAFGGILEIKEYLPAGFVQPVDGTGPISPIDWRHPTPLELREWLRSNGNFKVILELHTKTLRGHECITFRGTSERFFWAEVLTHRNSRNASSARAIPYKKMKKWILKDPAMHIHYGSNRPGMQAGEVIDDVDGCERELLELLDVVYDRMDGIVTKYDLHKEIANRYTEPWSWINWCASFSRPAFHNMLNLRAKPEAHPNYQRLAVSMARLYRGSEPIQLRPHEWHMPFVKDQWDWESEGAPSLTNCLEQDIQELIRWSVARACWTSYETIEQKVATLEEAIKRHDGCVSLAHVTPCEHQNQATADDSRSGTMIGYRQYRHMIPNESCSEFDFSCLDNEYKDRDFLIR